LVGRKLQVAQYVQRDTGRSQRADLFERVRKGFSLALGQHGIDLLGRLVLERSHLLHVGAHLLHVRRRTVGRTESRRAAAPRSAAGRRRDRWSTSWRSTSESRHQRTLLFMKAVLNLSNLLGLILRELQLGDKRSDGHIR